MPMQFIRKLHSLELEEKILNTGAVVAIAGSLMPWAGGQMLGTELVTYSGLGFYTSFLGLAVLLLNAFVLLITMIPLTGGRTLVKKKYRDSVRLLCGVQSLVLVVASLSVLTKVTFEFSRMEIRFGIYIALVGSIIVSLYSFLRLQEKKRSDVQDFFHQSEPEPPTQHNSHYESLESIPSSPPPEDHRLSL